jgi:phenylalanyl-tRNA synthetase beta chain
MGLVAAKFGSYILFKIAPYRLDVLNEQDIIEDIAIAYGYDNIKPLPVPGFSAGMQEDYKEYANRISKLMIGLNFSEAMNAYLTNEKLNFENCMHECDPASIVCIAYAKTEAITMLRTSILPQLLQNLGQSAHERMPQKLFEIGSTFEVVKGKVSERARLGIVSEHSKANFAEIKSVIDSVLKYYADGKYTIKALDDPAFIKGRCASITLGNEPIGYFGEIAPQVLENFRLEEPVVAAEIRMSALKGKQQS